VRLGHHASIRGRAARVLRGHRARYWKTNFGNWVKFCPPPPKCVASGATEGVTGSSVAQFGRDRGAASFSIPSAGGTGTVGDSLSSGVERRSPRGRSSPVVGAGVGTVASGFGVGGGILARAQAAMRVLWGSIAGVDQPLQAGHDNGVSGAARAPDGQSLVAQSGVGSSAQSEAAIWIEEKKQLQDQVERLQREVGQLTIQLNSKRARTRRENALMKKVLQEEHAVQVAELRSQAKAAWDAGAAQAAELATEQRITSELSHQVDLAEREIGILKALLRSTVGRSDTDPVDTDG